MGFSLPASIFAVIVIVSVVGSLTSHNYDQLISRSLPLKAIPLSKLGVTKLSSKLDALLSMLIA